MIEYRLTKTLSENLIGVESDEYGRELFDRSALRKDRKCAVCGVEIKKGEKAFKPITHGMNRMHRVHAECFL